MKEYAFIDLHIHTEYSNEYGCDLKVQDLLDTLQAKAEKENKDICFSITDHDSMLGCLKANTLLKQNPTKYNRLKFIPGIELNASLKNVQLDKDGHSVYSKCHMLGYGFDLNNKNLITFSKLSYKKIKVPREKVKKVYYNGQSYEIKEKTTYEYLNAGKQVIWAKNVLQKYYKRSIPFRLLDKCTDCKTYEELTNTFVEITSAYYKTTPEKIKKLTQECLQESARCSSTAIGNSKLDIFEILNIVKSAGGKTVMAHPGLLQFDKKDYENFDSKLTYIKNFVDIVQKKSNNKLDGLEAFHRENTKQPIFEALCNIAKEHNMYLTCGSDHHGVNLHPNAKLSKCFCKSFELNSVDNMQTLNYEVNNVIVSLPFVEDYVNRFNTTYKKQENKQDFVCKNVIKGKMKYYQVIDIMNRVRTAYKEQKENNANQNNLSL